MRHRHEYRPKLDTDPGRAYAGADCTLDGEPATIAGRALPFAIVAHYPRGLRVEYAWATVAHVMRDRGGAFRS